MTTDMDASSADEYYVTALQIFDYCGAEGTATLRVDSLMDKFAPFINTNKSESEYSFLKSLLDPDQVNPEINVSNLAKALNKYSVNQKGKMDLDESFNLRCGQAPQDSDSGISTDGYQLLEELQCELREKAHLAHQLRSQLEFTDRQHEEVLAAVTAERDSLRAHLNVLREENATLTHVRRDYEEACERIVSSERAYNDARGELDAHRKRAKLLDDQVARLEVEKLSLQELLTKSKDECHRINEMYASRQSALLEESETLRTEHADLSARLQDQDEFMQQIIKEKVLLEMELKDVLNKSNQTHLRLDRSIDVSYTEDQMLTALDSLNADSRFSQDNRLLDEESFASALREDQGRVTNVSLFDEIRLSFCRNVSRPDMINLSQCKDCLDSTTASNPQTDSDVDEIGLYFHTNNSNSNKVTVGTNANSVLDEKERYCHINKELVSVATQTDTDFDKNQLYYQGNKEAFTVTTQTDSELDEKEQYCDKNKNVVATLTERGFDRNELYHHKSKEAFSAATQTDSELDKKDLYTHLNKEAITASTQTESDICHCTIETQTDSNNSKCLECEQNKRYTENLEGEFFLSQSMMRESQLDIAAYKENMDLLERIVCEDESRNCALKSAVSRLQAELAVLEEACSEQRKIIAGLNCEMCCVGCQAESDVCTVSTQADASCLKCARRKTTKNCTLRRYFWEPLKSLFQLFAVVCFVAAVCTLYGVSRRGAGAGAGRCRDAVPWPWLRVQDFMDLLLSIEYVADVPM